MATQEDQATNINIRFTSKSGVKAPPSNIPTLQLTQSTQDSGANSSDLPRGFKAAPQGVKPPPQSVKAPQGVKPPPPGFQFPPHIAKGAAKPSITPRESVDYSEAPTTQVLTPKERPKSASSIVTIDSSEDGLPVKQMPSGPRPSNAAQLTTSRTQIANPGKACANDNSDQGNTSPKAKQGDIRI
jgi:hypothetical protein